MVIDSNRRAVAGKGFALLMRETRASTKYPGTPGATSTGTKYAMALLLLSASEEMEIPAGRGPGNRRKVRFIQAENSVMVLLDNQRFVDEEKGLDFHIHYVDAEKLVYWTDNPDQKYSLHRVCESDYLGRTRDAGVLGPRKRRG